MLTFDECFKDIMNDEYPNDRRMKVISDKNINGHSSENIRFIINECVRRYAKTYLEIGVFQGCSIISAAIYNEHVECIGIDSFIGMGKNSSVKRVNNNLSKLNLKNVQIIQNDYQEGLLKLFLNRPDLKIDVYFYDGDHSYEHQKKGLDIIKPYLNEKCVILVDDAIWVDVNRANMDWLEENKDFKTLFFHHSTPEKYKTEIEKEGCSIKDPYFVEEQKKKNLWWNGLRIFYRGL